MHLLQRNRNLGSFLLGGVLFLCPLRGSAQDSTTPPKAFKPDDGRLKFQGFGKDDIVVPYTAEDMQKAESLIARYDKNRDGILDQAEIKDGTWRFGKPLDFDLNQDGKINKVEMAQRLAVRATKDETAPPPQRFSVTEQMRKSRLVTPEPEPRRGYYRGEGGNRRSSELSYDILSRYDRDQNRRLDTFERKELGIDVTRYDINGDGFIDGTELYQWIDAQIGERVGDLTDVLPDWFFERDSNKDEQIDMSEFTDEWSDELLAQFTSFDANQDGVITAIELSESKSIVGGAYTSSKATLISPRSTVTSSIDVEEDLLIEKLRIQITITHDFTEQISVYLKTPSGKQIDLVRGAGGSGDHFEGTIFDDESGERIQRSTAPFRGSYQPVAVERNQPSLRSLQDTSLKGEWKLVIDADRNQRFGVLHSWAILVVPRKQKSLPTDSNESKTLEQSAAVSR